MLLVRFGYSTVPTTSNTFTTNTYTHTKERQGETQQQCRICIIPGNPYAALFQDNDDGIMFSDYHCFYFISIYFITTQHYIHWFNIHNDNFVRFTYYYCIIIIWAKITTTTVKKIKLVFFCSDETLKTKPKAYLLLFAPETSEPHRNSALCPKSKPIHRNFVIGLELLHKHHHFMCA